MSDEANTPETETKTPKRGVGTVIRERLLAGDTNEQALAAAKVEFPSAKTTLSTVSWYRTDMRAKGEAVQSAREVKKAKNEAAAEGAPAAPAADPLD